MKKTTLHKGMQFANMYWGYSAYVASGFAEEFMESILPCGM